ncbi:MAG: hypothetical protein HWE09_14115, partial [Cyclobacteriaceae bacterium]|nr:hypothetical protein [Cyclobacteriaceae bacterium]
MKKFYLLLLFVFSISVVGFGQTDSLVFKNKDVIVGEIKSMDRGVITIETDYSDKDFKAKWEDLIGIISKTNYLITLTDG